MPEVESIESKAMAAISTQLRPLRPAFYELAVAALLAEAAGVELLGVTVELDLPELGAVGPAFVVNLQPCPAIPAGPGQVITATFKHASADVLDLVLSNSYVPASSVESYRPSASERAFGTETIGVTGNHPFWSVDRLEFVQANDLVPPI